MAGPYSPLDLEDQESQTAILSADDVSSATALDDKEWAQPSARRARRSLADRIIAGIKSWRWLIDITLLLIILYLLLESRSARLQRDARDNERQITSDPAGFSPKISQRIMTFSPDLDFAPEDPAEFFSNKTQEKWLDLVPKGLGYVKIPHPEKYDDLPERLDEFTDFTAYTTSVTHQLHCLYAIAEMFNSMKTGRNDPHAWHASHCFEYLRQTIMCCGDTALEGQATTFPDGVTGSDGWNSKHVCKDYGQIKEYLEDNRVNDRRWI